MTSAALCFKIFAEHRVGVSCLKPFKGTDIQRKRIAFLFISVDYKNSKAALFFIPGGCRVYLVYIVFAGVLRGVINCIARHVKGFGINSYLKRSSAGVVYELAEGVISCRSPDSVMV